jgi:hypothetical protein
VRTLTELQVELVRGLETLISSLGFEPEARGPKPEAHLTQ